MILTLIFFLVQIIRGRKYVLLSPSNQFCIDDFQTIDDRIRGGNSFSFLSLKNEELIFYGILDSSILGAGFASQQMVFPQYQDFTDFEGISIQFGDSEEQKLISLNLYCNMSSRISYKVSLNPKGTVQIPFSAFVSMYRGKPKPNAPPLDLGHIEGFSFMMQSYFNKQKGEFLIPVREMTLFATSRRALFIQ